jgi:hypothetical protein
VEGSCREILWTKLELCIIEVLGSSLGPDVAYSDWCAFVVFLSTSRLIVEQYLKILQNRFFWSAFQFVVQKSSYNTT